MSMIRADLKKTGLMGGDLGFAAAVCSQGSFARSTATGNVSNPPIGDTWQISIMSALASVPVTLLKQTAQGNSQHVVGYTDQYGTFNQNGQFTAHDLGPQTWSWVAGAKPIGSWNFNVREPAGNGHVPPAALLRPMPSIIPLKPGQVSSSQMGFKCQVDSWVNANPLAGVLVALGIGWLLKRKS